MTILITGINGFVGSNLVESLKKKHNIYGLDIISPSINGVIQTFNWSELEKINSIDVIIHLAGKAHDTKNQTNAQAYFDINTGLTQKIYDWFLESTATKFIFFSSVKAAADIVKDVLVEDIIPSPKGPYGESKIAAENYILNKLKVDNDQLRAKKSNEKELSTINYQLSTKKKNYILRPCMIHGPGNKGNLNLLYQVVRSGIPYPLGAFENRRSFTSIDNLSFVIENLIDKDISSGIYNVGDDESFSTNELITLMASVMNRPARIWNWNKKLIQFLARIGTVLHLPLNSERLQKLTENYVVSNAKLKKALGIENMLVKTETGFEKTIKSFENK